MAADCDYELALSLSQPECDIKVQQIEFDRLLAVKLSNENKPRTKEDEQSRLLDEFMAKPFVTSHKIDVCNYCVRQNEIFAPGQKKNDDLALIFYPDKVDPNFSEHQEDLRLRIKYMAQEYNVFLKRISTIDQCLEYIKMLSRYFKLIHLEIGGHGTATSIDLGKQHIRVGHDSQKLKDMFGYLEPEAQILTLSCNNGAARRSGGDNMITFLAKLARGHRVIGTKIENSSLLDLKVKSARPLRLAWKYKGENVTISEYYN